MSELINKEKLVTILDHDTTDDMFDKNDLILIKLNYLLSEYKQDDIIEINNWYDTNSHNYTVKNDNGFDTLEYVVRNADEVFKSIRDTGSELLKLVKNYGKGETLDDLIHFCFCDYDATKELKQYFNHYIQKYGYPYLLDTEVQCPQYEEFTLDCIMLYLINEVRIWNFKTRENVLDGYECPIGDRFAKLYDMIKQELIYITLNTSGREIFDNFDKQEIIQFLNYGPSKYNLSGKEPSFEEYNKFFIILQRSLILFITNHINGKYKEQYIVSIQTPIYNESIEQYRLYKKANSLIGIAYDKLFLNLTATENSTERRICALPSCNNEFNAEGKIKYCSIHRSKDKNSQGYKERKVYENKRDYLKNYSNRQQTSQNDSKKNNA